MAKNERLKLDTKGKSEVREVPWGVFLWQMPDGSYISDGEGHFWMVFSTEDNFERLQRFKDSVRSEFGITEGRPCFFSGNRIVSDEEYEYQKQRFEWGLTPDPLDIAAIRDERRHKHEQRNR